METEMEMEELRALSGAGGGEVGERFAISSVGRSWREGRSAIPCSGVVGEAHLAKPTLQLLAHRYSHLTALV